MDYSQVRDNRDRDRIKKLNALTDPNTFWKTVSRYTRNVKCAYTKKRWNNLANKRFSEIVMHRNKPFEIIAYCCICDQETHEPLTEFTNRDYSRYVRARSTINTASELFNVVVDGTRSCSLEGSLCSIWNRDRLIYTGLLDANAIEAVRRFMKKSAA